MQFLRQHWRPLFQYAVALSLWANFFCLALYISNTTPLLILAGLGLASFFLPGRTPVAPMTLLALLFWVYLTACDLFVFTHSSGFGAYRRMAFAFLAGVAVFYAQKDRKAFFMLPLVAATVIVSCFACLFPDESHFVSGRLSLFMNHPNNLAFLYSIAATACCVPLLGLALPDGRLDDALIRPERLMRAFARNRWALLACFLVCFAGLWLTYSRTAFYAALAVCCLLSFAAAFRRFGFGRGAFVLFLAATLTGALLYAAPPSLLPESAAQRMLAVVKAPWEDATFRSRIPAWESALRAFQKQPLLGNGPESYSTTHAEYIAENLERLERELGRDMVERDTKKLPHAHNQYLMYLAESGALGLTLYLLLLGYPLCVAMRERDLFGLTVPLLLLFILLGTFEAPLSGSRSSAVGISVLFMLLGYFSGAERAPRGSHG